MKNTITFYSIGQVAKMFNLTVPTLRYYDSEGLIPNLQKNNSGIRIFSEENLRSIQIIECLKDSGMPIKDIRTFMQWTQAGDDTLQERYEMFEDLRHKVLGQMAKLQETLDVIDFKCGYYQQAVKDGTEKYVKKTHALPLNVELPE